jgi:mono/diheme cytochrome c family protein
MKINVSARKKAILNLAFVATCGALLYFLYLAPEESTSPLPQDETHAEFYLMASKKEADKHCVSCHGDDTELPLPAEHPPPYRCLFCHKRNG